MISEILAERRDAGVIRIQWKTNKAPVAVSVYAGESPTAIDNKTPVARTKTDCFVTISGLDRFRRYYLQLFPHNGRPIMVAERVVPMEGAANFRDLGGYKGLDGRHIRW
jgi:protein-tyrosine phosphatase